MGFNKKVLSKAVSELGKAKAPGKPKDIIVDPAGQWKYPGQETRIPSNDITMQGVDYPVWAQPNVGPGIMMQPGQDYLFPDADYVDETPMAKKGGTAGNLSSDNKAVTKVVNIKFDLPDLSGAKKIDDKVTLAMSPDSSGVFTIGKDVEKFSGIKESEVKADIAAGKESPEDAIIYGLTNVMNGGKDVYLWINGSRLQGMAKKHGADEAITEVVSHEALHLARHLITRAIAKKKGLNLNNEDWIKHDYGAGEYNWPAVGDESKENPIVQIDEESFATAEGLIVEQILPYFKEMAQSYLKGADSKEFKKGGTLQSKKYSKSMSATNKLMAKNKLFQNKKSKIFDPNAEFQQGGSKLGPINLNPNPLSHYELNYGFNLPVKQDGGESDYEELELTPEEIQAYKDGGYVVEEIPEQEIGGYVQHEIAKAQKGGSKIDNYKILPETFNYEGRPGARYRRDNYGNWLVADKNTNGKFVAVKDKTGKRQAELNKNAISSETGKTVSDYELDKIKDPQKRMVKKAWNDYNNMSTSEKVLDRVQAGMIDPLGMISRTVTGKQAYIPGMGRGVLNYENPEVRNNYLRELGYTPGLFDASDLQNIVNPMYWGASAGNQLHKGNYGQGALELGFALAGAGQGKNMLQGSKYLIDDVTKGAKYLGKTLGTESGLLSNAYKLNPFALKEVPKQLPGSPNAVNDVQKAGFDGNFLTRPLTLFTKNELLGSPENRLLYRKIGNAKGLQDLINKGGAQAPAPMRMTSGTTIDTPFFGPGSKPNENYRGLFAVEIDPANPKYSWSNYVGGTQNKGVAPYNPETGELVKNIPLEDLNVYKKKWFSNNYKKLKPEELEAGLMFAREQALIENAYKWGVRGTVADQIFNDGNYGKAIQNYFLGKPNTSRKKIVEGDDDYENGQANMAQPTFQTGGTRKPLVITDPKEFAYRNQMYNDSLSLYNQSQKIGNVGLPKISKEKYDEIERKNLDTPFYYFDNKQYNTDKKNKIYKSFNDYVITSTNGTIYDHPVYKKNNPDIVIPTLSDLEKHSIKLKNGNIKMPMDINNNKPDFSSYTIYNPNTGTTQFYSVDYLTNKPQLRDVYNNKIKPTITNYYGSDKPILDGTINVSEKSKTNNKLTSQLNKKYKNYWHAYTYRDIYEKPVQPVTFKKTNTPINKVNTLIPSNPEDIGLLPLRKINTQPVLTPEIIKGNHPLPVRKQYRKGVWSDGSKGKLPMGMSTEDYKRKNQEYINNLLKRNNVFTQTFQTGGLKDGIYVYANRPDATYKKIDNKWYISPSKGQDYQLIEKGDVKGRIAELEKNAMLKSDRKALDDHIKQYNAMHPRPWEEGPQSAGNSDWFWGPAALAITGAPAVAQAIKTAAPLVSSALNTAPSWLPGATINNALTAGFAGHGLYNIASGNVAEPWKKAMETGKGMDYVNALGENLMTALEVAPLVGPTVKGASNLLKAGKSTKMPVGLKGSPNATEAVENINIVRTPGIPQKPLPSFDTVNNAYDDLLMQSGNNELMARAEIADRYGREALNILDNPPTITSYPQTGSINLSRPVNHRANLNSLLNETELNINTPGYELPELSYDDFINQGLNSVSSPRETEQLTNMINDVQLRNRYEILRTRQRQGNQQFFNSPNALHNADGSLILSDAERASLSNTGSASSAQPAYARRTIRDFGQQNINTGPANRYSLDDFTNLNTNEINDSLLTGLRDYQNQLIKKQSLSKKIASKLSNVKNTFSTTLSDINQGIGDIIDSSKVDSLKKQIKATDIEADVNKLLENGLGIKKGDIKIKVLADPKNNDVKVLLNPYEYFSKNKDLIESTYGEGTYDEWMKGIGKDDWIDSGHLTLNPTFPEQASPRTFTQILSGKKFKPSTKFGLGLDINLPAPGLKRAGDFPFENWNSDFREKILDNLGVSGELTQALKQAAQNKGYEIYSGGTGHLYPGAKRYLRELLNDRVEIMNPEKADKLYYLLNDQDVLQKVNEALLNKNVNLPSDVHYALQNLVFKYKRKGGEMDSWEDELDDEEIERLKRAGYVVEEVGKYQTGGNVSDVWQKVTGTPWSEAKQKGFTSGSYDDNINLLNDLNSGKYSTSNPASPFDSKAPVNISGDANAKIKTAKNFNEAFSIARSTMGANQIFEYNGRKYGTNLKGENFTPSDNVLKASGLDTTKVKDRLVDQNKQLESPFLNKKTVKLEPDAYVSWEKVKQKNLDINKQSNAQKIIEYNKNKKNSKPYVIVDKKKGLMHIYDQSGKNLFTSAIDFGKNKGDAQTVTKYKDINKDGKINDADKVNGKFKVDWTAGNMNTGAGKFYIAHIDTKGYEGLPILNMMNEAQYDKFKKTGKIESIGTSIHKGYVKDDKSRVSNGCIRCNKTTLDNLVKYLSNTSEVYILPEDEKNEFVFENGKLNFKVGSGKDYNTYSDSMGRVQKGQGINKSTKTLNYIPIKTVLDKEKFKDEVFTALDFDDESEYQNVKQYTDALAKNKYKIMKATKINGDVYNELAKMSFGILGTESNYADTHKGFNNLGRAINKYFSPSTASSPDYESKYDTYGATENYRSVGLTQIRWNHLNADEKKALKELGITSNKDFLNPKKAAIATTAILAIRYQQQLTNKEKEDMWKYLPTKWNNRSNYASRVKNNSKYMSIMQQNKND